MTRSSHVQSNRPSKHLRVLAGALGLLLASQGVYATEDASASEKDGEHHHHHHRPPAEALEACKSLKSGDACSFNSSRHGAMTGTCWAPGDKPLACKPAKEPKS